MEGVLGEPLLHLDPARSALGRADLDVGIAQALQQSSAGAERGPEPVARQAVGPSHARTPSVDELDVDVGDLAEQIEFRGAEFVRPKVPRKWGLLRRLSGPEPANG
jgi:hypothetical protein